jgi:hypothetical protein
MFQDKSNYSLSKRAKNKMKISLLMCFKTKIFGWFSFFISLNKAIYSSRLGWVLKNGK